MKKVVRVLWFSRHTMTEPQQKALGNVEIVQVDGEMKNIHTPFEANVTIISEGKPFSEKRTVIFKEMQKDFDIIAAVMPLTLQEQTVKFLGEEKPFIISDMLRIERKNEKGETVTNEKGETQYDMIFGKWVKVIKIEVVKEDFEI